MAAEWRYLELGDFLVIAEAITGRRLVLSSDDTPESMATVLVDLAAHTISEREFVDWVAARLDEP